MVRLLIISADFPPALSPEASHAYHLAEEFARRGVAVTVLTSTTGNGSGPAGVDVARVMPSWSFMSLPLLAAFLRRSRPDAVLLIYLGTMYGHHPMITFAPTVARCLLPGTPFVTQFENISTDDTKSHVARLVRKIIRQWVTGSGTDYGYGTLLRDSHRVIVLSERHRAVLVDRHPDIASRSELIPPAPIMRMCPADDGSRQRTRVRLGLTEDDLAFCYYGYLYPGKGIETMLHAFATLGARYPEAKLVVVGGFIQHTFDRALASRSRSYEATIRQLAVELDIEKRIVWAGHCPSTEPEGSRYLRACDACVLPFDRGVLLNNSSFAAAAAHGLPIVTTVGPDTEKPFIDGQNVILCPPRDPEALARSMRRLIDDPGLRRHLALGADALAREWFDWDRVVHRIRATFGAG
jgi:glycosyltransferase involved in cell wall biosynthesis